MEPTILFDRVRAQPTALRTLERALERDKVHHAYLFVGPDGVGKELTAFALAQSLLCEARGEPPPQGGLFGGGAPPAAPSWKACGACGACARALPREGGLPAHPDLVVLERGLYTAQQLGHDRPEKTELSIQQVRRLVLARAAFPPHEGRAKVFLVRRPEEMNASAANALLKTLEEPGAKTHFILVTSQPNALLPTIRSRTLAVRFGPLPDVVVSEILAARGVATERAASIARLARGSVSRALELADDEASEAREVFVTRAIAAATSGDLREIIGLASEAKGEKGALTEHLSALADALSRRAREAATNDAREAERIATHGSHALAALEHLDMNGNVQLALEAMLVRMAR